MKFRGKEKRPNVLQKGLVHPGGRKATGAENKRRVKADRLFRKLDLLAVQKLEQILTNEKSTNLDLQQAIKIVFMHGTRPARNLAEMKIDGMAPVLVVVQGGDGWPEAIKDDAPAASNGTHNGSAH